MKQIVSTTLVVSLLTLAGVFAVVPVPSGSVASAADKETSDKETSDKEIMDQLTKIKKMVSDIEMKVKSKKMMMDAMGKEKTMKMLMEVTKMLEKIESP